MGTFSLGIKNERLVRGRVDSIIVVLLPGIWDHEIVKVKTKTGSLQGCKSASTRWPDLFAFPSFSSAKLSQQKWLLQNLSREDNVCTQGSTRFKLGMLAYSFVRRLTSFTSSQQRLIPHSRHFSACPTSISASSLKHKESLISWSPRKGSSYWCFVLLVFLVSITLPWL